MNSYQVYWIFYIMFLFFSCLFFYNWKKYEKENAPLLYLAIALISIYLMCGPFYSIFQTAHDIDLANEYRDYQSQVILPLEDRYNNIQVPDGYYYLGCEIINTQGLIEDGEYNYYYSFSPVDDENYNGTSYVYSSTVSLPNDRPYLLTMDSMTTETIEDDQIVVVWMCAN